MILVILNSDLNPEVKNTIKLIYLISTVQGPNTNNQLHNYTYNNNSENLFISLLGLSNESDYSQNNFNVNNIDIRIYSREYLESSFKIVGMRIKYSNGNVDIIGNGDSTTYDNYNQHLDYDLSGSGTNIPKILSTAPNSALYPTQNVNLPVDYKLNIQYNPKFYQVLDIVSKNIDKFVYNQILLLRNQVMKFRIN